MIELHVRNGHREASLKTESMTEKQMDFLLERTFQVLTYSEHEKTPPRAAQTARDGNKQDGIMLFTHAEQEKAVQTEQAEQTGQEKDTTQEEPEHWRTGIIVKDGEPLYKLRFECPNCGCKKNLYKPLGIEKVECRECMSLVKVEPATEKGFGPTEAHRDAWGNFMVARKQANRPRQLPLLGQETRSTFPIAELIREDERNELVGVNREG